MIWLNFGLSYPKNWVWAFSSTGNPNKTNPKNAGGNIMKFLKWLSEKSSHLKVKSKKNIAIAGESDAHPLHGKTILRDSSITSL
jgi:hypothetical protein